MKKNLIHHRIRRHGLAVAVATIGILLAIVSGEPGGAVMAAALAYVAGSAFLELRRHRWFGINAALVVVIGVLATGPATVLYTGDKMAYVTAPLVALMVLVLGYVVWLVVGAPAAWRRQVRQGGGFITGDPCATAPADSFNDDWSLHPGFARLRGNVWNRHYRFVHDDE